jgi:hypothetical protein
VTVAARAFSSSSSFINDDFECILSLLSFFIVRVSGRDGFESTSDVDPIDDERDKIGLLKNIYS